MNFSLECSQVQYFHCHKVTPALVSTKQQGVIKTKQASSEICKLPSKMVLNSNTTWLQNIPYGIFLA